MAETMDISARMTLVESAVGRLETSVGQIANSMRDYIEKQAQQPRVLPLKEIMLTIGATLTVLSFAIKFIDDRTESHFAVANHRIEILESTVASLRKVP